MTDGLTLLDFLEQRPRSSRPPVTKCTIIQMKAWGIETVTDLLSLTEHDFNRFFSTFSGNNRPSFSYYLEDNEYGYRWNSERAIDDPNEVYNSEPHERQTFFNDITSYTFHGDGVLPSASSYCVVLYLRQLQYYLKMQCLLLNTTSNNLNLNDVVSDPTAYVLGAFWRHEQLCLDERDSFPLFPEYTPHYNICNQYDFRYYDGSDERIRGSFDEQLSIVVMDIEDQLARFRNTDGRLLSYVIREESQVNKDLYVKDFLYNDYLNEQVGHVAEFIDQLLVQSGLHSGRTYSNDNKFVYDLIMKHFPIGEPLMKEWWDDNVELYNVNDGDGRRLFGVLKMQCFSRLVAHTIDLHLRSDDNEKGYKNEDERQSIWLMKEYRDKLSNCSESRRRPMIYFDRTQPYFPFDVYDDVMGAAFSWFESRAKSRKPNAVDVSDAERRAFRYIYLQGICDIEIYDHTQIMSFDETLDELRNKLRMKSRRMIKERNLSLLRYTVGVSPMSTYTDDETSLTPDYIIPCIFSETLDSALTNTHTRHTLWSSLEDDDFKLKYLEAYTPEDILVNHKYVKKWEANISVLRSYKDWRQIVKYWIDSRNNAYYCNLYSRKHLYDNDTYLRLKITVGEKEDDDQLYLSAPMEQTIHGYYFLEHNDSDEGDKKCFVSLPGRKRMRN